MTSTKRTAITPDERRRRAAELHATITTQVESLTTTAAWTRYLHYLTAFHDYSLNNVLLIAAQCPTATQVAGFRKWQENGRQVRKGEKAIRIFGYSTAKRTETDPETGDETETRVPRFPILSVFDISQTDPVEGADQQVPDIAPRLTGDDPARIYDRAAAVMADLGWTVTREPIAGPANGITSLDGSRRIRVDDALAPAMAAKTMLHEAAHALMHATTDPAELHRGTIEVEAESVAYVVAGLLGLDTSDYSVGYVAGWSAGDLDVIRDTAAAVLAAVHTLAAAIEDHDRADAA